MAAASPFLPALALAVALASAAAAQDGSGPHTGQKLKDGRGQVLGQIERVITDPGSGQPRQVLVRVQHVLHVLPVDGLTRSGDGYVTVLSKAELEALPAAE